MSKLYIMRGIPASGKTTKAREIVSKNPNHTVRYNWDDLRNMMGEYWVPERESTPFLKHNRQEFIDFWMTKGWDIVLDNTNLNPKDIEYYQKIVKKYNECHSSSYEIEFVNCFTPVEECIRRDKLRSHPIGEKVIKDFWRRYRDEIIHIESLEYSKSFENNGLPNAIIVDLDATVALNLSKRPFFGKGCKEGISNDIPIPATINIIENFIGKVLFITGRSEDCREATEKWINEHIHLKEPITYNLYMREDKDYSSGADFKLNVYKKNIKPFYNVLYVLEDSNKVVDVFRKENLFVLQPINGTY